MRCSVGMTPRAAGWTLVFLSLHCLASGVAADARTVVHEDRLGNGLRIALAPDPAASVVAVSASFDAGSRNEAAAALGSAGRTARAVAARVPGLEASANQERAVLSGSFAPRDLPRALESLAAVMRLACRPEAAELAAPPAGSGPLASEADVALLRLSYASFSYAHPAGGAGPDRGAIAPFFCRHYAPNTLVLAIAGRFETKTALRLARTVFTSLRRRRSPPPVATGARPPSAERRLTLNDPGLQAPRIYVSYVTVRADQPDWYALNILADALGNGEGSRMQRALVAAGLASRFLEGMTENRAPSLLRMRVDLSGPTADPAPVEEAMDRELARLREEPITPAELESARESERSAAAESRKTSLDVANTLSRFVTYFDDAKRLDGELPRLLAVTAEDVRRVARRYLVKENRAVVVARPWPGSGPAARGLCCEDPGRCRESVVKAPPGRSRRGARLRVWP
ncbi:MAG: insulinase family protein [Acidobacteria bacterium]|nr:insulinase family protein [Acidobacteriota bacterium]MCA1612056.1 insulinase family protein [Acidobacteriota bacterium]